MAKRKRESPIISSVEELPFLAARSANHLPGFNTNPPASFYLPRLSVPGPCNNNDANLHFASSSAFSVNTLTAAIQNDCSLGAIKRYIASYNSWEIEKVNQSGVKAVENMPLSWGALFFCIERNSPELLRVLLDIGMKPNAMSASEPSLPAVVFAIISSKWTLRDPTEVVETLLAYGASPNSIPLFFWRDFFQDLDTGEINKAYIESCLRVRGLTVQQFSQAQRTAWITDPGMNAALIDTFHFTLRYMFFRASQIPEVSQRRSEMYKAFKMEHVLRLPFFAFQRIASELVVDHVFAHECMHTNLKKPLVMAFSGPTGHGQIELAKEMGKLLSAPFKAVDCSQIKSISQLFTGPPKFHQHPDVSTLADFLSKMAGKRAIVFLDDFNDLKKSGALFHEELICVMKSGTYMDMGTHKTIDTSNIIWILNTKLGHSEVLRASGENLTQDNGKRLKWLQDALTAWLAVKWRNGYKDLIRTVIPFLDFNNGERALAAHKLLLQLYEDVRRPVDMTSDVKRCIGNVHLGILNATNMCYEMAEDQYDIRRGALSYFRSIEEIKTKLCAAYSQIKEKSPEENTDCTLQSFEVSFNATPDRRDFDLDSEADSDGSDWGMNLHVPTVFVVTSNGSKSPKRLVKPYHQLEPKDIAWKEHET